PNTWKHSTRTEASDLSYKLLKASSLFLERLFYCVILKEKQMRTTVKAADLMEVGYQPNEFLGLAIKLANENYADVPTHEVIALFQKVKNYPELFLEDEILNELAAKLEEDAKIPKIKPLTLKDERQDYKI